MSTHVAVNADPGTAQAGPAEHGAGKLVGALFQEHSTSVFAVCRLMLTDAADAEDAMQQTFYSAHRAILAGSVPRRPDVWLRAIARNECLDRIRTRRRQALAENGSDNAVHSPDALAAAIAGEEFRALGRSIKDLPAQQREALVLHELCGLPYGEVAATIGVSESAIGSLLLRARRRLRSALRGAYGALPAPGLWNAFDHLVARASAVKVAALPAAAALGSGVVAVGLTTGVVVTVDRHGVKTHRQHSRPVQVSTTPAARRAPAASRVAVAAAPVVTPVRRAPAPVVVSPVVRPRVHTPAPAKVSHGSPAVPRTEPTATVPDEPPIPVAQSESQGGHGSISPPGHARPDRPATAIGSSNAEKQKPQPQSHGKAAEPARGNSATAHAAHSSSSNAGGQGQSDAVPGGGNGNGNGNASGVSAPNGNGVGSPPAQPPANGVGNSAAEEHRANDQAAGTPGKSGHDHPGH